MGPVLLYLPRIGKIVKNSGMKRKGWNRKKVVLELFALSGNGFLLSSGEALGMHWADLELTSGNCKLGDC